MFELKNWVSRWNKFSKKTKTYRIGVCGATGSGKTCLLAALAMDRLPNPEGYGCTWLPTDDETAKAALKSAINALLEKNLPNATKTNDGIATFYFNFAADRRTYNVELVDYAGEFLNPDIQKDAASGLLKQLRRMDAFLLLAPTPSQEKPAADLSRELLDLRRTFEALREAIKQSKQDLDIPIAVVFNAWDRKMGEVPRDVDPISHWKEQMVELERCLYQSEEMLPHRALVDVLKNSVSAENLALFPVSAIGACQTEVINLQERISLKKVSPLHAFGLENPFIWVLRRRDTIDVSEFEQNVTRLSNTRPLHFIPWPWPVMQLCREGSQLAARFPTDSDVRKKTCDNKKHLHQIIAIRSGMFILALLVTEAWVDRMNHNTNATILANPTANAEQIAKAEAWLEQYIGAFPLRHRLYKIIFSTKAAKEDLNQIRTGREDVVVYGFKDTNLDKRVEAAEQYLRAYPNGKHTLEAKNILAKTLLEKDWGKFVQNYTRLLNSEGQVQSLLEAAQGLVKRIPETPELRKLKEEFPDRALEQIKSVVDGYASKREWKKAKDVLEHAAQLPTHLDSTSLRAGIRSLQENLSERWDRGLYEAAKQDMNLDALQDYLNNAPLGFMRSAIEQRIDYIKNQEGIIKWRLRLDNVSWGEGMLDDIKTHVQVNVQGFSIIDKSFEKDYFRKSSYASRQFEAKAGDQISIWVRAEGEDLPLFPEGGPIDGNDKIVLTDSSHFEVTIGNEQERSKFYFSILKDVASAEAMPTWTR